MIFNSYGTLGFVVKITLQIVEYKPYIRLTYRPCYTLSDTVELLSSETHKESVGGEDAYLCAVLCAS